MTVLNKCVLSFIAGLIVASAMIYFAPKPPPAVTKSEVEHSTSVAHTQTTTVTTKKTDGEVVTTTTTDQTKTADKTDQKTVQVPVFSPYHLDALAGIDIRSHEPIYGISVSKQFIGPISLGAFGLTSGIVGVSAGVSF